MPDYAWEKSLPEGPIAGVDEVGYGAWAGPVGVAAVILSLENIPSLFLEKIQDSKKLTPRRREDLVQDFLQHPAWGKWTLAWVKVEHINEGNVLQETLSAMAEAAFMLHPKGVVVDGNHAIPCPLPQRWGPKGDQQSWSIAMASILAKVHRDRRMETLSLEYPLFHWQQNKGYGTQAHREAVLTHGLTPHHRLRYCRKILEKKEAMR